MKYNFIELTGLHGGPIFIKEEAIISILRLDNDGKTYVTMNNSQTETVTDTPDEIFSKMYANKMQNKG